VPAVLDRAGLLEVQAAAERIEVDPAVLGYAVDLVGATRSDPRAEVGASPRGSLALLKLGRARALLDGRAFVVPDDVKRSALPGLAHRILVKPEPWIRGVRGIDVVKAALERVPVPKIP
jgi:MoxR-like ATPase